MCEHGVVEDHLSPLGASFLYLEEPTTVMHVGSVLVLDPGPDGLDVERFMHLVEARIVASSRYRQKVRELPGRFASPFWVDAADFDLTYHVRRAALPRPGTREQLEEFVARILSRPLDRAHPLWELYVVEGLERGRVAVVTKTHQALVDGVSAVDIAHLIVDDHQTARPQPPPLPPPGREPSDLELLASTALRVARRPSRWVGAVAGGVAEVVSVAGRALDQSKSVASALVRTAADPAPASPLNARVGASRRVAFASVPLEEFRGVRDAYLQLGASRDTNVTDVILTVITGALRSWLQTRGEPVHAAATVRAMVPVSVAEPGGGIGIGGSVQACFVDLPVGETSPLMRLEQVTFQMRRQVRGGRAVGARAISDIAGFAPTTLHHLGAQLGNAASRRFFNLVITNVPGPQHPLWVAGARMEVNYPIIPLALGQALSFGLTSYDGRVGIGLNGDRAAMHDLEDFVGYLRESLAELEIAVDAERRRTQGTPVSRPLHPGTGDAAPGGADPRRGEAIWHRDGAGEEDGVTATRVFVAIGETGLRALAQEGRLVGSDVRASAVTPTVRQAFPADDEEELEYDALQVAAELTAQERPGERIVVAAVDVDPEHVEEVPPGAGVDGFEVRIRSDIPATRVRSVHAAERGGDAEAELLWYDASELTALAEGRI